LFIRVLIKKALCALEARRFVQIIPTDMIDLRLVQVSSRISQNAHLQRCDLSGLTSSIEQGTRRKDETQSSYIRNLAASLRSLVLPTKLDLPVKR
jgi:uncharacterized membrane protein YjjP (DUF1212 family)